MAEIELTSTEADALSGTTDSETDFKYHTIAESTYYTEGFRQRHRVLAILKTLGNRFRVYKDGTATFGVRAGKLDDGDTTYTYAATTGQSLTNDQTNYIYLSIASGALALTVNTSDWTITRAMADPYYQFSDAAGSLELCQIDATSFLCAYGGGGQDGLATVLTVDTSDWSLSHGAPFTFEPGICAEPVLCQIDAQHYLCGHTGSLDAGYAGVLELSGGILP